MSKVRRGRDQFYKYRFFLNLITKFFSLFSTNFSKGLLSFFRMTNGKIGLAIRYCLLKSITSVGDNVAIYPGVFLLNPENLVIGDNVSIHPMTYIDAAGHITIGSDVSIAHGTTILSSTHEYQDLDKLIKNQGVTYSKTIIEDNVWIGAKVTILMGVKVASGVVIAANSLVNKNTDKNCVIAGTPAITKKERGTTNYAKGG